MEVSYDVGLRVYLYTVLSTMCTLVCRHVCSMGGIGVCMRTCVDRGVIPTGQSVHTCLWHLWVT